ncbi:MAG: hypothetical protein LAQ69_38580 [Acidobacteriia bacterium]|nr:hypothetical protein [Terriglobia bacterium]
MARVFEANPALKYTPNKGDSLESIAASNKECQADKITWQELALFNWGTIEPREVNRALVEILGCPLGGVDWSNPQKTTLDPAFAPTSGDKTLLIPKLWKKDGLALEKTHTIKVRRRKPMPAVRITKLSQWFVPEKETCDISYSLEGIPERADKVGWEVLADNYHSATAPKAGADFAESVFTPSDEPIRQELVPGKDKPRKDYDFNEWDGESKAAAGILAPEKGGKAFLTVAKSPYTVQFRFYLNDAHKNARIRLSSFYPRWKRPAAAAAKPALDDTTLKIKWKVEKCSVLKHGQLLIWDDAHKADEPLFRQALGVNDLTEGDHEFDWSAGKAVVVPEHMPYYVQVQAHTGVDDDDGVAVAAMHTRVMVHSIALELGDFEKGIFDDAKTTNKGHRERLKALGYFHGAIAEDPADAKFKKAVEWFQSEQDAAAPAKGTVGATTQAKITERLPYIIEGGSLSNADKKKIYVSGAFFYETEAALDADGLHHRFKAEKDFWGDGLKIPVYARIFLKGKGGGKVDAPKSVGAVKVQFEWVDKSENPTTLAGKQKDYVEKASDYYKDTTTPKGLACHKDRGGKRGDSVVKVFPENTDTTKFPFYVKKVPDSGRGWAVASTARSVTGDQQGLAGVIFSPSRLGGDTYRIYAYLHQERDLATDPEKDTFPEREYTTENMQVWRRVRVNQYLHKPDPGVNEISLATINVELAKAYMEFTGNLAKTDITAADWTAKTNAALAGDADVATIGKVDFASLNVVDFKSYADYSAAVTAAGGAPLAAAAYTALCKGKVMRWVKLIIKEFAKNQYHGMTMIRAGWAHSAYVPNSGFGFSDGVCYVFWPKASYDALSYVVEKYGLHEMGHCLYLRHHYIDATSGFFGRLLVNSANPKDHDKDDDACALSYYQTAWHLCGKCSLKLRGWDEEPLKPDGDDNKKP